MTIINQDVARLIEEQLKSGRYISADEVLLAALKLLQERGNGGHSNGTKEQKTIDTAGTKDDSLAAIFAEIAKDVPDSEWEKLPRDLAQNLDHYLYGTPKDS